MDSIENSHKTIRALLADATAKIGRFEAAILLGHVLGKPREFLIAHDDEVVDDTKILAFTMLVDSRIEGMPVPYLTGRQEFFGRYFTVDNNVLIPRPDTEVLIEQAQVVIPEKARILDLGTGSGCIAVTLALQYPEASVTATDFSPGALAVAKKNASDLGARVEFREGSWWAPIPFDETFDIIVSNPPYIESNDPHLRALGYEPRTALTDGSTGLTALETIICGAPIHLVPGGWLLVEHGYDQGEAVRAIFKETGFAAIRTIRDYGDNERVTMGRRI